MEMIILLLLVVIVFLAWYAYYTSHECSECGKNVFPEKPLHISKNEYWCSRCTVKRWMNN